MTSSPPEGGIVLRFSQSHRSAAGCNRHSRGEAGAVQLDNTAGRGRDGEQRSRSAKDIRESSALKGVFRVGGTAGDG